MELEGKSAIVTDGSMGIGRAICVGLAREGANVALNFRKHDAEARGVVKDVEKLGRKGLAIKADVASFKDAQNMVQTVLKEWGCLHILVCNAGINWDGVIWKMTEEQWDTVITTNLKGYFNYNRAAAPIFKDQKWGKIVNISSINGIRGKFAQVNYSASKGGEIAMTKALAKEMGKFNVNCNCVAPGMVMTDMAEKLPPDIIERAVNETVLGRIASSEDVANVVVFLCTDKARHITGEVIKVDGGQYI